MLTRILGRKRLATFAAAFFFGILVANMTFTLVFESGRNLERVLNAGETDGVAILQQTSRSIYTSRIPTTLALSLDKMPSVRTETLVASMCYTSGSTLLTRGTQSALSFADKLVSGTLPQSEGLWIILGDRIAKRLHAKIGETIPVASSLQRTIHLLTVAAICRFNDMRDDEALVHERIARQLSGLPEGMVSAIVVHGLTRSNIETLLGRTYQLRIKCTSDVSGTLVVSEANGAPIRALKLLKEIEEDLELPFGYYAIIFQNPYLQSTLGTILLDSDQMFQGSVRIEETPTLRVLTPARPVLRKPDGAEIEPARQNEFWVFKVSAGVYRLELGTEAYVIPLYYSAIFDPRMANIGAHSIHISVTHGDGSPASGCNLVVKKPGGEIVLSVIAPTGEVKVDLARGDYVVEAYQLPYLAQATLSVPTDDKIKLVLASVKANVEKIPIQYYTLVKAVSVLDIPSFTLASISGISAALFVGLSASITILFTMMIVSVQTFLYVSAKNRLILLPLLGAPRGFLVKTVLLPGLVLNVGLSAAAALASSVLLSLILDSVTIFGHSIQVDSAISLVFSLCLAALVWFWGCLNLMKVSALST